MPAPCGATDEEVLDFGDLDVSVSHLEGVAEDLEAVAGALEPIVAKLRPQLRPKLVVDARNGHWLRQQVCYDAGVRCFVGSNLVQMRSISDSLPDDIVWRVVNVRASTAKKVVSRVPNLEFVSGVDEPDLLDALHSAASASSRLKKTGRPLSVLLSVPGDDVTQVAQLAEHAATKCPSVLVCGLHLTRVPKDPDLLMSTVKELREAVAGSCGQALDSVEICLPIEAVEDIEKLAPALVTGSSSLLITL